MFKKPGSTHIHWTIWAYSAKTVTAEHGESFLGTIQVDVLADTLGEALARAEKVCPRRTNEGGYEVRSAVEHLPGECSKK